MIMKRFSLTLLVALFVAVCAMQAQMPTYSLSVENQRVVGEELQFDIYMENTSVQDIYVGECDLVLGFNNQYFADPSFRVEMTNSDFAKKNYNFESTILGDKLAVAISSPNVDLSSKDKVDASVQVIPANSSKLLIGKGVVTGIATPAGTAGLQWVNNGKFSTKVSSYQNVQPWKLYFITEGGKFENPNDVALSPSTGINEQNPVAGQSQISIYPNPVKSDFTVKTAQANGEVFVKVFSVAGSEILSVRQNLSNGEVKLALPFETASGNYVVKVQDATTNEMIGTHPLVVSK